MVETELSCVVVVRGTVGTRVAVCGKLPLALRLPLGTEPLGTTECGREGTTEWGREPL